MEHALSDGMLDARQSESSHANRQVALPEIGHFNDIFGNY